MGWIEAARRLRLSPMQQERQTKWNPWILAWALAGAILVMVVLGKRVLGSAWPVAFAILMTLVFLAFCVQTYRRREETADRVSLLAWSGWAGMVGGPVLSAAGQGGLGLPIMFVGLGC
jgi:hypothetical protein